MSNKENSAVVRGELAIARSLYAFVENELCPDSGVTHEEFWDSLESIVKQLGPRNAQLLKKRDELQAQIDDWHRAHREQAHDPDGYRAFLKSIGYLCDKIDAVQLQTSKIDREIAVVPGPQLVVPLDNARYVLNAANARWGSLYDALYGTDAVGEDDGAERTRKYNPIRGDRVINYARDFLDRHFGLDKGSHSQATAYRVKDGELFVRMGNGNNGQLLRPERLVGYTGDPDKPDTIILGKNDLWVELKFGEGYFIGRRDHANIYDIVLESAISAIMDCEDSVASVDVDDKLTVYRNWLGLVKGSLKETFEKDGETINRELVSDREILDRDGKQRLLPGRCLMLVRNVGAHLETDAVLLNGEPIAETILDAMITCLAGKHDLLGNSRYKNSREGSIYVVKPKMHGPEEVALAGKLFDLVEDALGIERHTLKMGIMDEERRTSVNLASCIAQVPERVFFINTGFLDRTGDEIHTCMEAGPVLPKEEMKSAQWLLSYENSNVDLGLASGFMGRAQIGKGMWAAPDAMAAMIQTKIGHPKAGATTAWVPSPTVATLHAMHYHLLDVRERQRDLLARSKELIDDMLSLPLLPEDRVLSDLEKQLELENNAQGLLGYVSRWVGQGIGCSKVPDINNVDLMEDCATLRISSQHIANWLYHGLYTEKQVRETMEKMAHFVDSQNALDPNYSPMTGHLDSSFRFQAALDLIFKGREQPNGYTEYILTESRRGVKSSAAAE
ncbi:MAG: malate synthase G [Pseudomonadota bacterium]